jgi:hypothetical protein
MVGSLIAGSQASGGVFTGMVTTGQGNRAGNSGTDQVSYVGAKGGQALIIWTVSFQANQGAGLQFTCSVDGGPNLVVFGGTFNPGVTAVHAGTPPCFYTVILPVSLPAGNHTVAWNYSPQIDTSATQVTTSLTVLFT